MGFVMTKDSVNVTLDLSAPTVKVSVTGTPIATITVNALRAVPAYVILVSLDQTALLNVEDLGIASPTSASATIVTVVSSASRNVMDMGHVTGTITTVLVMPTGVVPSVQEEVVPALTSTVMGTESVTREPVNASVI